MRVLTITSPDMENGLGCRLTIWFSGCSHFCPQCHNQHTWDYNQGTPLMNNDVQYKIYDDVDKEYINGITLAGGDPLSQTDESLNILLEFLKKFKEDFPNKTIWIYSGEVYEVDSKHPIKKQILDLCDVLIDGPFKIEELDNEIAFRGSKNQRIIDLNQTRINNRIIELNIQ